MIRILQVVPNMNSGGIENYIMNMLRVIDRERFHFDFLEHHEATSFFDEEIRDYGCTIHRIPVLDSKNLYAYNRDLKALFRSQHYDIVHGHAASLAYFYLGAAEKAGVPVRIAHSHGTSFLRTPKGYAKRFVFQQAKRHANVRLACSTEAGKYLFGNEPFTIAKNAIDTERFAFDSDLRRNVRQRLGVDDDTLLVGHIGRFNLQKNHEFLLRIFAELKKKRSKSKLLLVGEGETKQHIIDLSKNISISEDVLFEKVTDTPQAYYSAMDVFVLPSLFEGLPLVGIEAQCNGLPCLFASSITRETQVTDLAQFISLDEGFNVWASVLASVSMMPSRMGYSLAVKNAGYDYHDNTIKMQQFYQQCLETVQQS